MSKNHQYPEFDTPVARWRKAVVYKVTGVRLSPYNESERIDFLLESKEDQPFSYFDDVIELYSEKESRLFAVLNRAAIERGLLIPYTEAPKEVVTSNALTDDELKDLATYGNKVQFTAKVKEITSWVTLSRLLTQLTENSPKWREDAIKARLAELANN